MDIARSTGLLGCSIRMLTSFHDLLGWNKERLHQVIDECHADDQNCSLLVWSVNTASTSGLQLQLIHSLLIGHDRKAKQRVVGFQGYANFDSPIEVPAKLVTGRNPEIWQLKGNKEHGTALPSYSALVGKSIESFMDKFDHETLSTEALAEAKKIPQASSGLATGYCK